MQPDLDKEMKIAELQKIQAETFKILAEAYAIKVKADAEVLKSNTEVQKIKKDLKWYFITIATTLFAMIPAFFKAFK